MRAPAGGRRSLTEPRPQVALKRPEWWPVFSLTAFGFLLPVAAAASRGRAGPHHPGVPVLGLATERREGCLLLTLCCWSLGVRKDSGPGQDSDPSLGSVSCDWLPGSVCRGGSAWAQGTRGLPWTQGRSPCPAPLPWTACDPFLEATARCTPGPPPLVPKVTLGPGGLLSRQAKSVLARSAVSQRVEPRQSCEPLSRRGSP